VQKNPAALIAGAALLALTVACGDSKARPAASAGTPATTAAAASTPTVDVASATAVATARSATAPAANASAMPARQASAIATTASAGGPDPCSLVTQPEAETVLGGASAGSRTQMTALLNQCQYAPAAPSADPTDAVTVQVFPGSDPLTWPLRRDTFKRTDPTVQTVTGVGDEAFWVGDQSALFVLRHGVVFDVRVPGSGAVALANARSLAQKAAGRVG